MKILTVIKRELLTRVRTKGFLLFTLGIPVVAAAFGFMEFKIIQTSGHVSSTVAVVDLSQTVYPELARTVEARNDATSHINVSPVAATADSLPSVEAELRQQVLAKQLDGYVVIPADVLSSRTAKLHTRNAAAIAVAEVLQGDLRDAVNRAHMAAAGITPDKIATIVGGFDLSQAQVTATGETSDNGQALFVAFGLIFVLFLALLLYGVVIMRAVTEEKTSRISEVLLSAVDPYSLMMGKILGVIATALCQFAVWGVCLALFAVYGVAMIKASGVEVAKYLPHISPWVFVAFAVFFLCGFLLYAGIYAAIGAMVSNDQEAQQTQVPLSILMVASFYLAFLVIAQPSSLVSVVLSLVPFFAPILMVARVAVSSPPLWQVVLSAVLCLATAVGCVKITGKIYRVGILMTGKRPNLPELLRWLKYA